MNKDCPFCNMDLPVGSDWMVNKETFKWHLAGHSGSNNKLRDKAKQYAKQWMAIESLITRQQEVVKESDFEGFLLNILTEAQEFNQNNNEKTKDN